MIYSLTCNPALDYCLQLPVFMAGELNRAERTGILAGGKGINVSRALKALGFDSLCLGFAAGWSGHVLLDLLREEGLRQALTILPEGLTRINVKLHHGNETEINAPGPAVCADAVRQLFERFDALTQGDVLILSGSLAPGLTADFYASILKMLEGRSITAVVDTAGQALELTLPYHPFLIKPNLAELSALFETAPQSTQEIVNCARQLQEKGARNVLVSMGSRGSLLLTESSDVQFLPAHPGEALSTVGAGDAMVAGFVAGWLENNDWMHAHCLASASGGASALFPGPITKKSIESLLT